MIHFKRIFCTVLLSTFISTNAAATELRVITYNVAMGVLLKKPYSLWIKRRFIKNRKLKNAAIIGLQEVCANKPRIEKLFTNILKAKYKKVYRYLGLQNPDASSGDGCIKGQLLLSAHPIVNAGKIQLPRVGSSRSAIWADLLVDTKPIRVYNLHLSNRDGSNYSPLEGRLKQANAVLEHINFFAASNPDLPILLMGDFNSLVKLYNPWVIEPAIESIMNFLQPTIKYFCPTMVVPYKTDWIFYKNIKLNQSKVVRIFASDHFPVVANFSF